MRSNRFATILVLMCSCYAVGSGCGDDDEPGKPPAGGTGGRGDASAGRGGSSGSAGRGGAGATGGGAGMGGGMGTAGMGATGGTGGRGGSAGTTGSGGTNGSGGSAGTAGADASPDATGGTANDSGPDVSDASGGTAGDAASDATDAGAQLKSCVERCTTADDCRIGDAATTALTCNSQGRCAVPNSFPSACTANTECMVRARVTALDCDASNACANPNQACADGGGGKGKCVTKAPADGGSCTGITNPDRVTVNVLGGDGGQADVCMNDDNRCGPEHTCYVAVCQSDEQCSLALGGPICNTQTGRCDCMTDNDCGSVQNTNKCVNGRCGCGDAAACTVKTFNGTTVACE